MQDTLFLVGEFNESFNTVLAVPLQYTCIYQSKGLITHIFKKHKECLPYVDRIPEIIQNPDYIGVNPNEKGVSIELVKVFDRNILIGVKLDTKNDYLFISTLYDITDAKLTARCKCGRLRKFSDLTE